MKKIDYQLPDPKNNWIVSTYLEDEFVLIYHKLGVSISHDFGKTFFEAKFDKDFKAESKMPFVLIDRVNKRIFLDIFQFFVSDDMGVSFHRQNLGDFDSINNISYDDHDLYLAKSFGMGHDTCDKNVIYHSIGGEREFREIYFGEDGCAVAYEVYLHQRVLYVRTSNGLIKSEDQAKTFHKISTEDPVWKAYLLAKTQSKERYAKKWKTIANKFPAAKILPSKSFFYISYTNPEFRTSKPTPGIAYTLDDGSYLSSDLAARMGGFQSQDKIYYSSFQDVWVEN